MKKILFLAWILVSVLGVTLAQNKEKQAESTPVPGGEISTTRHSVKINGAAIAYTASAGTMQLRDEENKPIALFGFTGYARDGNGDLSRRPIVFAYNGGPGSSSIWLHMGALGPKRVVVNDAGFTPGAPYRIESNGFSLLDIADLVMIDPVGTGLSVPVGEAKFTDFWGVDQDIRTVSLFVKQYLVENKRLNSPKYLLGESYGTFRSAGIMDYDGVALLAAGHRAIMDQYVTTLANIPHHIDGLVVFAERTVLGWGHADLVIAVIHYRAH